MARLGIDVGGTFTDLVVSDDQRGLTAWKTPTTRPNPSEGIFNGIAELRDARLLRVEDLDEVTVGTTIALNAILSHTGARTALLTTRGFRDVLAIGRESRRSLYDLQEDSRPNVVPRNLRFELDERMDWQGNVIRGLDRNELLKIVDTLTAHDVESVAICLLHAYANPAHEIQARDVLRDRQPRLAVTLSHEVLPQYREYERTLAAVLNAYVQPVLEEYLRGFREGLGALQPSAALFVAHSAGGVMRPEMAARRAINSALSGPAAGVMGATECCAQISCSDFVTMDMGGTSCDVAIIRGGSPETSPQLELGASYTIGLRSVDVQSVSAGGGTIAWVDSGGVLRAGPHSAGAVPGPACYGRGGAEPTVTDAHVALGRIDPSAALGSGVDLNPEAARDVIQRRLGDELSMSVEDAAAGVLAVANAALVRAVEVVSIERGHDPRDFALVAFGGAAPLHASTVAHELDISRVIVPSYSGMLCGLGTLCLNETYDVSRSVLTPTLATDPIELARMLEDLEREALALFPEGTRSAARTETRASMRYEGQTFSLELPLERPRDAADLARLHAEFEVQYERAFGYIIPGTPSELETLRAVAVVDRKSPGFPEVHRSAATEQEAARPWSAHFDEYGWQECASMSLDGLQVDARLNGPAVIRASGSTAVIRPQDTATRDSHGHLIIDISSKSGK